MGYFNLCESLYVNVVLLSNFLKCAPTYFLNQLDRIVFR